MAARAEDERGPEHGLELRELPSRDPIGEPPAHLLLALAARVGATPLRTDFVGRSERWPIVVDCGTDPQGFSWALRATEAEGALHSVSYYGAQPTVPVPLGRL